SRRGTRVRGARVASDRARSHLNPRRDAGPAQRLPSAETTPRLRSTSYGKIYRTKNKDQPPLRRADFWTVEISRAEKLSARNARPERFAAETIRIRDCSRRETETSLSVWSA